MSRPKVKGRGAREQGRADRRAEYAASIAPHLSGLVQVTSPADRVLLVGDDLVPLAERLAKQLTEGSVALVTTEFDRWEAARSALAAYPNVTVLQELEELRDPDGFPTLPWTLGVLLPPAHLGPKTVLLVIGEMLSWLAMGAPIYAGGSRMHEWNSASERLSALAGPLATIYTSDPVRVVKGMAHGGALELKFDPFA